MVDKYYAVHRIILIYLYIYILAMDFETCQKQNVILMMSWLVKVIEINNYFL